MSESESPVAADPFGHRQEQQRRQNRRHLQTLLKEATKAGHEAISIGDRESLEKLVEDAMCQLLGIHGPADVRSINEIFLEREVECSTYGLSEVMKRGASEVRPGLLIEAFRSLETISRELRHDSASLEAEQAVRGLETTLGVRYLRVESAEGGDLKIYDHDEDLKAILFAGSQGAGKTSGRKTLLEDRIAAGHKVVDVIDFHKSENSTFDIESQNEKLDDWRRRLGLEVGFSDPVETGFAWLLDEDRGDAYRPPDVEILAPLTPGLASSLVPIDQETGSSVVKPFTIPASDLSYRQLVMLLAHTTRTHENYLKAAHQKMTIDGGDWNLRDVAEAVRTRTNAGEKVADRIERSLETAQRKSFIRDADADHRLDWREMMADAGTVSAFTVHNVREHSDKLLIVSYLLDKLYQTRNELLAETRDLDDYPVLTLGLGELHSVAPRIKAEQDIESTIEGYMIDTLSDLFALMRHANIEIIADTQKFHQQLSPSVSTLFHEIFTFQGQKSDVKKIFQTRVDTTTPVEDVSQYDIGQCAHVSGNGYKLPIRFAPPRSHHLDAKRDGDGLSFRTTVEEDVELEPAPWSAAIPERLSFGGHKTDLERFFDEAVDHTEDPRDFVYTDRVVAAFQCWRTANDRDYEEHYVRSKIRDHFELEDSDKSVKMPVTGKRKSIRKRIQLKPAVFGQEDRAFLFDEGWEHRVFEDISAPSGDGDDATAD